MPIREILLLLVGGLILLGFLGAQSPWFDLLGQFRLLYSILLMLLSAGFLIFRQFNLLILALGFFVLNLMPLLPYYHQPPTVNRVNQVSPSLKLLQFNTWASNQHPEKVAQLLQQTQPDLVTFQEYTPQTDQFLKQVQAFKAFPYQAHYKKDRLKLLSRFPLYKESLQTSLWPPTLRATIDWNLQPLTILVVHTWRPLHPDYPHQMERLQYLIQTAPKPLIVTGDFNTAPWGHAYQQLLQKTGLEDAERGFGIHPTYPAIFPKTQIPTVFPLLPLDHVLTSPDLQPIQYQYAISAGSDHLPLLITLTLPKTNTNASKSPTDL